MSEARPAPGGQSYVERQPVPALAGVASSVWIQQVAPDADPYTHRTIPNGAVELRFATGSAPRVVGPQTTPVVDVLEPGATVVGVRLIPGAAPSVLGLPASEVVDLTLRHRRDLGRSAGALGERLDGAATPDAALAELQRQIAGRMAGAAATDSLVSEVVRQLMPWRSDDVGSITSMLYISETQLRRRCRTAVGLAPKVLHRMLRFQGFLALVQHAIAQGKPPTDERLALLAAEAGYADQPHLNRECLRLTGVSPRALLGEIEQTCASAHDHAVFFTPMLRSRPERRHA